MTDPLKDLADTAPDVRLAPAHGIATIALSLAMKYHDIATVQDGQLYQQYKLEGRNMVPLHLDMVFETAIRIERHLIASSDRIAEIIVDALEATTEGEDHGPGTDQSRATASGQEAADEAGGGSGGSNQAPR